MGRILSGELPGGKCIGVIGTESVLELFCSRAGGDTSFVPFALGIEGPG
jgi:hypothetical protein